MVSSCCLKSAGVSVRFQLFWVGKKGTGAGIGKEVCLLTFSFFLLQEVTLFIYPLSKLAKTASTSCREDFTVLEVDTSKQEKRSSEFTDKQRSLLGQYEYQKK